MTEAQSQAQPQPSSADGDYSEAMRLLAERPGQADFLSAVALLENAFSRGFAAAGERLAAFHALAANGSADRRRWDRAFDELLAAAELGSASAGRQLLVLAALAEDARIPEYIEPDFWRTVRSGIDLNRLLGAPERKMVRDSPRIRLIEGFASAAECRWVIDSSRRVMAPATVFDPATGALIQNPARSNSAVSLMLGQMDVVSEILRTRIALATRVPVRVFEPAQILRYEVGQEFLPHVDFLDPDSAAYDEELARQGQRIATFLIYLNADYEGGETVFPDIGLRYRGRTGDALFWANLDRQQRPDPLTRHAGLPPTSGEKWVFSQWIGERPLS